jgi:hypothetical protein
MGYLWAGSIGFYFDPPKHPDDGEYWWRAEDRRYADYDPWAEFEQPNSSHLRIELRPYRVVRHTKHGVWLGGLFQQDRFVLGTATKQFAVPTIELAVADLIARKRRHVEGCEARLRRAQSHLAAAEYVASELAERPRPAEEATHSLAHKCANGALKMTYSDPQRPTAGR